VERQSAQLLGLQSALRRRDSPPGSSGPESPAFVFVHVALEVRALSLAGPIGPTGIPGRAGYGKDCSIWVVPWCSRVGGGPGRLEPRGRLG
jgi:hypothetical protein